MEGSDDLGGLPTEQWKRLQDMASRFEAAWQHSDTVDLTAFLPPPEDPLYHAALHELIKTDMESRWRRGQIIGIEAYLERFPRIGTAADVSAALIYEEYRVRHLYGDKPPLAGYERRFGRQFAELKRLIGQHPVPDLSATSASAPAEPPPVASQQTLRIGGEYKMLRILGCGGFAEVWAAETPAGFPVAIKRVLRPLDHAEAQVELRALGEIKQLRHPYLLQTRDYGLLDNRLYIVMDLAECTLADRHRQCQAAGETGMPLDELLRYIREAAEAIDYMHSKKVHHRDIKPKNILLDGGHAKVADFGLARMIESQRLTNTGSGTAPYMAPEVWRRQVSPHTDQYSLAVSYAELRLGRLPFAGTDMYSLMMDHIEGRPNLDGLPNDEQEVLRKAMAKNPDERYPSCLAFAQALETAVEPVLVATASVGQSPRRSGIHKRSTVGPTDKFGTMMPHDTPTEPPPTQVDSDLATPSPVGWKPVPPKKSRGLPWSVVVGACVLLVGLVVWKWLGRTTGSYVVGQPAAVTLKAGDSTVLHMPVERSQFDGLIRFSSSPGAGGVTISGFCDQGSDNAEVTVRAEKEADLGELVVEVHGEAEGQEPRDVKVTVTVQPSYWKDDWRIGRDAIGMKDVHNRRHYSQIEVVRGGVSVPFVLVRQEVPKGDGDLSTFYIMRDKVWNELYSKFAAAEPVSAGKTWEKGGQRVDGDNTIDIGNSDGRLPALRMTVTEAYQCALWLGGNLPTLRQWDKPAGYYKSKKPYGPYRLPDDRSDSRDGPTWKPLEIAINRAKEGPMPVGEARYDVSPYGCHDMAGNGLEWTRNVAGPESRMVPINNPDTDDRILLRGSRYSEPAPWLFRNVTNDNYRKMWPYTGANSFGPELGFRVVIEDLN
jgi:serine/threonine protein kinase/formylglycine-generating enzyme required for sulfatase activity